jgi:hypothetical protein
MGMDIVQQAVVLPVLLILCASYVFGAYVLYRVGSKFGIGTFGLYCIPVYNSILLCRCVGISPWLLFLLLVPLANLIFIVYLWGTIAKALGHNFWLFGLGILLFAIPALVLAFDDSGPARKSGTITFTEPTILCMSGEFAGSQLRIGTAGLVIGRSAEKSNLVLSSLEVSAVHTKVWSDLEGHVWVQDLSSSNGTYYCHPRPDLPPQWTQVTEPVVLASGTHFRLGDNVVEFVVS